MCYYIAIKHHVSKLYVNSCHHLPQVNCGFQPTTVQTAVSLFPKQSYHLTLITDCGFGREQKDLKCLLVISVENVVPAITQSQYQQSSLRKSKVTWFATVPVPRPPPVPHCLYFRDGETFQEQVFPHNLQPDSLSRQRYAVTI